jgi:5-methylcytosine-specific restriction endonuclease McrA
MPRKNTPHPYDALNKHFNDLAKGYATIERGKEQLRKAQASQAILVEAALFYAHRNDELQAFAQSIYFDGPQGLARDHIRYALSRLVKNPQHFLCSGYTVDVPCSACGQDFPYPVKSFSDLKDLEKSRDIPRTSPKWHRLKYRRCIECEATHTQRTDEQWRAAAQERAAHVHALRTMPYRDYLKTDHWQDIRLRALKRAKFLCQLCNTSGQLHVHHRSYKHRGEEQYAMHDVIVLCAMCHAKHHDIDGE